VDQKSRKEYYYISVPTLSFLAFLLKNVEDIPDPLEDIDLQTSCYNTSYQSYYYDIISITHP